MMAEAADARRCSDEASALRRELAQLNSELLKGQQELSDHKQRARQQQAEAAKAMSECEKRARDLSQQLMVSGRTTAYHQWFAPSSRCSGPEIQLSAAP
jgi:predicted  nucleic acid-binding Zn-ribbon protein